MKKIQINDVISRTELIDINGTEVDIPQKGKFVHLQFRLAVQAFCRVPDLQHSHGTVEK
jgi:hypothetical protein